MALDFPSNPIDGQIYGSYTWSSSRGVWQAREESAATAITSPIAPATANPGDIWVNTSAGIAFVYYDDGNSSQWMELLSSAVPNTAETMPVASIIQTARISAPTGWLLCQGQSLLVDDYSALHAAIGYTYGGTGANFLLPDLRGRVPVGKSDSGTFVSLNSSGGVQSTSLGVEHIPQHSHTINHDHAAFDTATAGTHTHWISGAAYDDGNMSSSGTSNTQDYGLAADAGTYSSTDPNKAYGRYSSSTGSAHAHTIDVPAFSGSSGNWGTATVTPVSALQPYIVLNYMIKV